MDALRTSRRLRRFGAGIALIGALALAACTATGDVDVEDGVDATFDVDPTD